MKDGGDLVNREVSSGDRPGHKVTAGHGQFPCIMPQVQPQLHLGSQFHIL